MLLTGSWSALRHRDVQRADVWVGDLLRRAGFPALDRAVAYTTDLGSLYAVSGMSAVLAGARRPQLSADVLAIGATAWVLAQGAKRGVLRARPYEADGVRRLVRPPAGSSFPSGHAAVAMAVLELVAGRSSAALAAPALRAAGGYVAASRVYVGVHYPTDVIGGAGLGLLLGAVWRGPIATAGRRLVSLAGATARLQATRVGRSAWQSVRGRVTARPPGA